MKTIQVLVILIWHMQHTLLTLLWIAKPQLSAEISPESPCIKGFIFGHGYIVSNSGNSLSGHLEDQLVNNVGCEQSAYALQTVTSAQN